MKHQNIIDLFTITVGLPSIIAIIIGISSMISLSIIIWDNLSKLEKISASVSIAFIVFASILWLTIRLRQSYFVIPKLLIEAHKRATYLVNKALTDNKYDLPEDVKMNSLKILGGDIDRLADVFLESEEQFTNELTKQVKDIGDTFGTPEAINSLGWFLDSGQKGVDAIALSDDKYKNLNQRIIHYLENPPSPEVVGAMRNFRNYSYKANSAILYKDKIGYEALVKDGGEIPTVTAYKYAMPEITQYRLSILLGIVHKEIRNFYKGK